MIRVIRQLSGIAVFGGLVAGFAWLPFANPEQETAEPLAVRHLALSRTIPAADTVLTQSPPEIRLIFTEAPQAGVSTVRLTRGPEQLVPSSETAPDPRDAKQLLIRPAAPLAPGAYTVHWRVVAQDGHTQRGTFDFRLAAD